MSKRKAQQPAARALLEPATDDCTVSQQATEIHQATEQGYKAMLGVANDHFTKQKT